MEIQANEKNGNGSCFICFSPENRDLRQRTTWNMRMETNETIQFQMPFDDFLWMIM